MSGVLKNAGAAAGFVLICESAGIIGGLATFRAIPEWYVHLRKPSFTPPGSAFGPVWTTLYALMGIAAWLVWKRSSAGERRVALSAFFLQLALNAGWSLIFFGLRSPRWAFFELIALLAAVIVTVVLFWRVSKIAAALLLPYLVWSTFAAVLTFSIWRLNK